MVVKCPECSSGCPVCHYTTFVCTEKVPMPVEGQILRLRVTTPIRDIIIPPDGPKFPEPV